VSLRQQYHFREARKLLEFARQRLEPAGPNDLHRQVDQCWADLDLAERLDAARIQGATFVDGRFVPTGAEPLYASAFVDAGLGREGDDSGTVAGTVPGWPSSPRSRAWPNCPGSWRPLWAGSRARATGTRCRC